VTKDEAVELLSSVLKKNGYAVTRNGRILTIMAMDTVKTADTDIVVNTDPNEVEKGDEVQTQIIPVRYASATQLVPNLELLLPTTATLSANESATTLILVATRTDIKRILKIVNALDTSMASASSIKVRPLRFADAKETANLITQLFTQQSSTTPGQGPNFGGGGGRGGFGGFRAMMAQMANGGGRGDRNSVAGKVVAVADDRSNSVVISAPADLLTAIDDMLDKIDTQVSDTTELRVFRLTNADPSELSDQLAQLFPDETSANNNQNNNVPFFFRGRGGLANQAGNQTSDHMKKMGKVLTVADPRTSSLIVTASKTLMPQIAEMISELDSDRGKREVVSYFELQNADPQDVYQNLQDLFNRSTVRMQNNNNQNSFLGRNHPLTQRETQNQQGTTATSTSGLGNTGGGLGGGGRAFGQ
jgi:general secretion pathway protein D